MANKLLLLILAAGIGFIAWRQYSAKSPAILPAARPAAEIQPTAKPAAPRSIEKTNSLFVPYWSLKDTPNRPFDRYFYFGIGLNRNGIIKDEGYANTENFLEAYPENRWLVVRMTDTNSNIAVLNDPGSWETAIGSAVSLAGEKNFDGIALDLEVGTIPLDRIVNKIYDFTALFYKTTAKANLPAAVILYGDNFYRQRPYYIEGIAKLGGEIIVMAYDFHKAAGEPGPNFPLSGGDKYDYDFSRMIDDFSRYVSPDKLTITFGMYGYDWQVDDKKKPISPAKPITFLQARENLITNCKWESCTVRSDDLSAETEVDYVKSKIVNEFGYMDFHIVWFETPESVEKKQKLMEQKGIGGSAFWANGYF